MKNFFLYFVQLTIAVSSLSLAQGFDLMNVTPSQKVASSSPFTITSNGIEKFQTTSLSLPFAIISSDTLLVTNEEHTTTVEEEGIMSAASTLHQNFPNPFNNSTVIRFSVNEISDVTIKVYDVTGREVTTLVEGTKHSGTFSVGFSHNSIASGTYLYRMTARNTAGKTTVETKKMIVMK